MTTPRRLLRPAFAALAATATSDVPLDAPRERSTVRARRLPVPRPELGALMALAALLNLWSLSINGWANEYYSAAVRSMTTSWHAFLFGSFDASGVMTVDKPPLALWVQALSARIFGFDSWSILVPEALMGVATVALVYDLVRRRFGRLAGFGAGLVLAVTPISVAISRHNNPDALLILCVVAALWCVVRGLEDGRTRWLVLAGVAVGLGFEAKMGAALLVVPALAAAWMWVAPRGRLAAVRQLLAGGAAMAVVGGAWPLLMWMTPTSQRPWISGTADNSIWSLIFGYNGLGRLDGQAGGPAGAAGGPGGGGGGGGLFGGSAGPLRLLNQAMGGQAGWFLGFALLAGLAIAIASRLRRGDARTGWVIAVGGSFLTTAVAFSVAQGIFHPYYVSELAPFTAALVGGGAAQLARGGTVARVLAPLAIVAGVAAETKILSDNTGSLTWLPSLLLAGGALAAVALLWLGRGPWRAAVLAAAVGLLAIAPATWAAQTLGHATNGTFPAGGPASAGGDGPGGPRGALGRVGANLGGPPPGALAGGGAPPQAAGGFGPPPGAGVPGAGATARRGGLGFGGGGGMFGGDSTSLNAALKYTRAHGGGTIAVSSQQGAATAVISGKDVAALGGFSGRESEVSASWLTSAVRSGEVRWVLTGGDSRGPQDSRVGSRSIMSIVASTCTKVTGAGVSSGAALYDCQGRAAAIAAG